MHRKHLICLLAPSWLLHVSRRVSARDSGKPLLDAIMGEVMVTCEKIHWLCKEGEKFLRPEKRSAGIMVSHQGARCTGSQLQRPHQLGGREGHGRLRTVRMGSVKEAVRPRLLPTHRG